jgi:hypothetical protein
MVNRPAVPLRRNDFKNLQNKTDYTQANPLLRDEDDDNPVNVREYKNTGMDVPVFCA